MFESVLTHLFTDLKTLSDVALVSYEGLVLEHYQRDSGEESLERVHAVTPLIQQMKTGFQLMGLGEVTSLSLEGPNRKFICCPIDRSYLLVGIVDAEEYEGRVVFELSSAASQILGDFH